MSFSKFHVTLCEPEPEPDVPYNIDIKESDISQVDISEDEYVRSRYKGREEFSYVKLCIGMFCVGLLLFATIEMYTRYKERKEMEAAIQALEEIGREWENDYRRTMDRISGLPQALPKDRSKALPQEPIYKDVEEYYQLPDGTWVNEKRRVEAHADERPVASDWVQEDIKRLKKMRLEGDMQLEEMHYKMREEQRIAEEKKRVGDISNYERVDVSNAGAVKSEWEFFEDSR